MKVLVIDDEPTVRSTIAKMLTLNGYDVLTASDGNEGLELLRDTGCQLVITDWIMPGMDGLEFCSAVRSSDLPHYVYVIMVTGRDQPEDKVSGLTGGADDYVTKPFNPIELLTRLNTGRRIIGLESREMTIFALAKLAESRDPETGAHLERVRSYCRILALELQQHEEFADEIDDAFVRLLYETSPLHDIGKVAIPDAVLLKPDSLTFDEFELMKTHTIHGAETLAAAAARFPHAEFLRMAHDIALTHHERYNGTGYPNGLAGGNIPLAGRIVALADVYDALTSKRIYKEALPHDHAKQIITKASGTHFDPAIVDAFCSVEDRFIDIREQHQDDEPVTDCQYADSSLLAVAHSG